MIAYHLQVLSVRRSFSDEYPSAQNDKPDELGTPSSEWETRR